MGVVLEYAAAHPNKILAFSHTLNLEQMKIIGEQMSKKGKNCP